MLNKENLYKLEKINNDYSDLVIKFDIYIEREIPFLDKNIYSTFDELVKNFNKDCFYIIFGDMNIELENAYMVKKTKNNQAILEEDLYYTGKKYFEKIKSFYIEKSLIEKIAMYNEVKFVFCINSISTFPIFETKMHRKIVRVLDEINNLAEEDITEENITEIIQRDEIKEISNKKQYDIDLIIKYVIELSKNKLTSVAFVCERLGSREKFLIGELRKLVYAAGLEPSKRNEYIYDTTYKDMNEMFSKFGFCNFKGNKCLSQRHKSLTNRYPVPKTDGCCFKVFNKCNYNNKDGTCKIECLACKLFTCPYLSKLGVGLRISELLLMRAFMNKKQKRLLIYKFYKPKEFFVKRMS